jgi:hypothetical protein
MPSKIQASMEHAYKNPFGSLLKTDCEQLNMCLKACFGKLNQLKITNK